MDEVKHDMLQISAGFFFIPLVKKGWGEESYRDPPWDDTC